MSPSAGRPNRRRRAVVPSVVVAVAVVVATLPVLASRAAAVVTPVNPPQTIEVFPSIDMVGVAGFTDPFVVEVWRNGVKVGDSGEPVRADLFELNHAGAPCWSGSTPDIMAGDEVRVVTDNSDPGDPVGQFMTVADLDADTPRLVSLDADGVANDLVMTGRALTLDGTAPLPIARMAAEVVQPAFRDAGAGWDRRAIGAAPGVTMPNATRLFAQDDSGVLAYEPVGERNPDGSRWTATWKNLPEAIGELALGGAHTISSWERDGGVEGVGLTITDAEEANGPSGGACPPSASDSVTATSYGPVNIAAAHSGKDLVVSGTSYNAAAVRVTVDDADGETADAVTVEATVTHPAPVGHTSAPVQGKHQTWTAQVPMAALETLDDGVLTISGEYDRVVGHAEADGTYNHAATPISGRTRTILKDVVAPQPPTVFPAGGTYYGTQNVTVTADDDAQETVRYTAGTTNPRDPGLTSPVVPVPYAVTGSQEFEVASFDRVGNRSSTVAASYDIRAVTAPGVPTEVTTEARDRAVALAWTAPAENGGRPVTEYSVRTFDAAGALVSTTPVDTTTAVVGALTNGRQYTFDVRAVNEVAPGAAARSAAVTPRTVPAAPAIAAPVAGNAAATVRWAASDDGGSAITGYTVRVYAGDAVVRTDEAPVGTSYAVTGLDNGTAYSFDVVARNDAGTGPASARSAAVTPRAEFVPPTVTARGPVSNSTVVSQGRNVTVTFSEPVTGVSGTTVQLFRSGTATTVAASVSYNPGTRVATLDPTGNLVADSRYTVSLMGGITDVAGNRLGAASWTFTTGPRPTVKTRTPGAGAKNVRRASSVSVTFTERVNGVSTTTATLTQVSGGAAVRGTVSYNASTRTLTFNPYGTARTVLRARTAYRVTLTSGIRDGAGNPLTATSWVFTTGAS